jgi:glycosyltransferase involved in cell wall biosynthesis
MGSFCLYHGSLEVGENNEAAIYLVNKVFNDISIPLIIAGNKPSPELRQAVSNSGNIEIKDNITTNEIYELVRKSQINILPTFQSTGIKLKLLAALFSGRHCIVNSYMVKNTGLETLCTVIDNPIEMKQEIKRLIDVPFTKDDIVLRENALNNSIFSNKRNINQLIKLLFPNPV